MNRIKQYFINQTSRPASMLAYDFFVIGGFVACVYYGFIH